MKSLKIVSFLLTLIIIVPVLFSCTVSPDAPETKAPDKSESVTAATSSTTLTDTESVTESETLEQIGISPDVKFPGETVSILYWSDVERPEFDIQGQTADIVNDAIYKKNNAVKEALEINFNWIPHEGNFGNQESFVKYVEQDVSNEHEVDIIAGYSLTAATMTVRGYLSDLKKQDYLDFDKPWWPKSLTEKAMINDKLYFCSGDISTNMLHMMYATIYNKNLFEKYNTGVDIYDLVKNKRWTLEKMYELCEGVYDDLDGSSSKSYGDLYGFMTIDLHFDAFYSGADLQTVEKDKSGHLVVSDDFTSEKAEKLCESVNNFLHVSQFAFADGTTSKYSSAQAFKNNLAMFIIDRVYVTSGTLKDVKDFKIGVLPIPMFDENQEDYVTCMAFPYTMYSISSTSNRKNVAAATLEYLGYEGYATVTPVLFETSMKLRYVSSEADAQMFDLIRASISIDLGRIFTTMLNNHSYLTFRNAIKNNTKGWRTLSKVSKNIMTTAMKDINTAIDELK